MANVSQPYFRNRCGPRLAPVRVIFDRVPPCKPSVDSGNDRTRPVCALPYWCLRLGLQDGSIYPHSLLIESQVDLLAIAGPEVSDQLCELLQVPEQLGRR